MPYFSSAQRKAVWAKRKAQHDKLDPLRWDKPIIAPEEGEPLTKRDVFNYYSDMNIRRKLLAQLRGRPVIGIQSLDPTRHVLRRNRIKDDPIRINKAERDADNPKDLAWFTERRFSEFHPVIGERVKQVWVDIDPDKKVPANRVKDITTQIAKKLKTLPSVKDTEVAFSGGRGFHVRGNLKGLMHVDEARRSLNRLLKPVVQDAEDLTLSPPQEGEVRLDTSTLHDKGSLRALYSLNSDTGLAAVPVDLSKLKDFDPKVDADPRKLVTKKYKPRRLGKEFAPGIPKTRKTHSIPQKENTNWTLSVQEHNALKAGKHWDLRLIDPDTGHAHSWAVPKAKFPESGKGPLLAVHTPTHSAHYALNFGALGKQRIGKGYGKGDVEIRHKGPIKVLNSNDKKVKFERTGEQGKEQYLLFKTKGNNWLIRNTTPQEKKGSLMPVLTAYERGRQDVFIKLGVARIEKRPNTAESRRPLEEEDQGMPASELAKMLGSIDAPIRGKVDQKPGTSVEARLNKKTTWDAGVDLPYDTATGPSPVLNVF